MKTSPTNNASKGKRKARRRSRTTAPENNAIAPTGVKFHGCGAIRSAAAARIIARTTKDRSAMLSFLPFSVFISLLNWQQIAINERISLDYFSGANRNRFTENRPIENERVELTVFAAGINTRWQVPEECFVELASGKAAIKNLAIDTYCDGTESSRMKFANQL